MPLMQQTLLKSTLDELSPVFAAIDKKKRQVQKNKRKEHKVLKEVLNNYSQSDFVYNQKLQAVFKAMAEERMTFKVVTNRLNIGDNSIEQPVLTKYDTAILKSQKAFELDMKALSQQYEKFNTTIHELVEQSKCKLYQQ